MTNADAYLFYGLHAVTQFVAFHMCTTSHKLCSLVFEGLPKVIGISDMYFQSRTVFPGHWIFCSLHSVTQFVVKYVFPATFCVRRLLRWFSVVAAIARRSLIRDSKLPDVYSFKTTQGICTALKIFYGHEPNHPPLPHRLKKWLNFSLQNNHSKVPKCFLFLLCMSQGYSSSSFVCIFKYII